MRKSIIICLILCIIVPLSSEAKKQAFGNGVYWELSDGVLTISGTGSMPDFNYFKGNKIIKAPWYDEGIKIRKVIVEEGVTSIGCQSFYAVENYFKGWPIEDKEKYRNIISIELPKSIKVIGNYAFYGLKGLNKVFLYEGLQTIGEHAFSGSSLQEIVFPSTIQNIGRYAFKSCSKIQKVELPQSLTVIEAYCFQYCESLSFVKWPTSLKVIEELAFDGCNLSNLNLPGGVKVGGYAFKDNGIKTLNIPLDCILDANRGPFHPSQTNTYCDVQIICLPTYINVQNANRYGLSITSVQNYANSIKDNTGKVIVALKEGQEISQLTTKGSNIYYCIKDGSFIGIVDRSGMWIISLDQRCSKAEMAGDNYVKFEHNCNYGVIRLDGKEIIPTNRGYSSIEYNSSKGTFAVAKPGYTGVCDVQGNEISLTKLPPTANEIKASGGYASAMELNNGSTKYWKVSKGGRYGLTDAEGKVIVPTEMEALESAGTGYLRYKLNGFLGLMDYAGKIIIDTDRGYTSIGDFKTFNKRFAYTMAGYKGECDINGRQISKIKVETPPQQQEVVSNSPSTVASFYSADLKAYDLRGKVKKCTWKGSYVDTDYLPILKYSNGESITDFTQDGKLQMKNWEIIRDSYGRITKLVSELSLYYELYYDEKGRLVKLKRALPQLERLANYYYYSYDSSDRITSSGEDPNNPTFRFEYIQSDSNGNWTKRIEKSQLGDITHTREIEYY